MPSIPQSLLWISLVVLWLFVLVPMLINKRDTVRRTSDIALATRVLNSGVRSRLIRRRGPAAGHRHDPNWQPDAYADAYAEEFPDQFDKDGRFAEQQDVVQEFDDAVREARVRSMVIVTAVSDHIISGSAVPEPDYLDVDVVEDNSGALPVGGIAAQAGLFDEPVVSDAGSSDEETATMTAQVGPEAEPEPTPTVDEHDDAADQVDEYEFIEDTSGLEAEAEPAMSASRSANRRRRMENSTAVAVSARKYLFRKRVLTAIAAATALTAVLSVAVTPSLWWTCGAVAGVMVLYLGYLRRQTRIEAQIRRRRQQRQNRPWSLVEETTPTWGAEAAPDRFPTRLQRPGAVVLEIDDEDPVFEHLDELAYSGSRYRPDGAATDLPRAAGQ